MNGISEQALAALTAGGRRAAEESDLDEALRALGEAAAEATGAEAVVIRVTGENGMLDARSVVSRSEVLAAELAGSTFPLVELKGDECRGEQLPEAVRRAARRARAADVVLLTARGGGKVLGSLTLFHSRRVFAPGDMVAARFAASHLGLVLRAFLDTNGAAAADRASFARALALAGDALAVGLERAKAADEVVRISARAAGAEAAVLWYPGLEGALELLASVGPIDALPRQERAGRALAEREPVRLEADGDGHGRTVASFTLGQPPVGVLELAFPAGASPSQAEIDRLTTFAVRAAQALRAGERAEAMSLELERSEALLAVVGQATAELSLAHTLETAVARVSELLRAERVAVYLRQGTRLRPEAGQGVTGSELAVAERLLELAFGPLRAQGMLHVSDAQADLRLASVNEAVHEAQIDAVLAVPLVAREELIGLLAAYLPRGRELSDNESALLAALASQLAVVVQNAQLHERTERLASEREEALAAERQSAKRLRALYEISRSFAQSLSLDATLDAVDASAPSSCSMPTRPCQDAGRAAATSSSPGRSTSPTRGSRSRCARC